MTPQELSALILVIAGVLLQLSLKYAPKLSKWYNTNANKGTIALALDVLIGGILYALACSPFALDLKIPLVCDKAGIFTLLQSIFILAMGQQGAYLFGRKTK
jgi:hypothetical protein